MSRPEPLTICPHCGHTRHRRHPCHHCDGRVRAGYRGFLGRYHDDHCARQRSRDIDQLASRRTHGHL
jgi:hypothetical protein